MTKRVVVLGDCHIGSKLAVAPEDALISQMSPAEPTILQLNKVQKALLKAWESIVEEWQRPDILVINGEPMEGDQRKNIGSEVWSPNLKDQIDAAVTLVKQFKPKKIYLTRGSDYHSTIEGTQLEEFFGEQVGATKVDGYYAPNEITDEVEGVSFNFAHHIGGTSIWQYRSTAISRELAMMLLNQNHRWKAQVVIRSHNHFFWHVESTSHHGFLTPAWKSQDWLSYRRGAAGGAPDIGAIRFIVKGDSFDWEKRIFNFPEIKPPHVVDK